MRRFLTYFLFATLACLWAAGLLDANPITLDLDPLGGSTSGAPGDTVGWGFTLTNSTASWISVTSSALTFETNPTLGTYTDFIGLQGGPLPSFAVAPFTAWSEVFDGVSQGIGSYAISSSATLFAADSGQILVSFDEFNGDPTNGGAQTGSSSISAAFAVDVAPGAEIPEPSMLPLAAAIFAVVVAAGFRRGSAKTLYHL